MQRSARHGNGKIGSANGAAANALFANGLYFSDTRSRIYTENKTMARILIADDDELIAELASEVLIDVGHACGWVTNADDAWEVAHKRRPDLLLLDQDMPGMTGVTLLRKLRGSAQFYDLPVVMFTAMGGAQDEAQAIYAGAQDYIRKPFDPSLLITRVARVLAKREGRPRHIDLKTSVMREAGLLRERNEATQRFL